MGPLASYRPDRPRGIHEAKGATSLHRNRCDPGDLLVFFKSSKQA